jgi:hypothetical protein
MSTIADALSPATLDEIEQAFRLEVQRHISEADMDFEDEIESLMGFVTSSHLWDAMWRFGIILDDDAAKVSSLGNYWRDEDGRLDTRYYVPDDFDTQIPLVSVDCPPTVDVAWDAKPLN